MIDEDSTLVSQAKKGDKIALNVLLAKYMPTIKAAASRFGNILPQSAVQASGMGLLIDAVEKFDTKADAVFRTFLGHHLKGMNRYVNQNKQAIRIPESRANKAGLFQTAFSAVGRELGRDPTDNELGDYMGVGSSDAAEMRSLFHKKEISHEGLAGGVVATAYSTGQEIMTYYINNPALPSEERAWLEHLAGINGKQKLTVNDIATRYHVPAHRIYAAQARFKDAVEQRSGSNAARLLD